MANRKKGLSVGSTILLMLSGFFALGLYVSAMLRGNNIAVLNSKGLIANEQRELIIISILLVLTIAVPTLVLLYFVAWRYRESNGKATYKPSAKTGKLFVLGAWGVPALFMLVLAFVLVPATHRLEPKKAIASDAEPMTIQVVAMRWKWLFIYPDQQIATVNYVQIPEDRPVTFVLTADEAPMSSFWIPNLGGQLYAMTGHVNQLNLIADETGDYPGSTAEINGPGFANMRFTARVTTQQDFDAWTQTMKSSPKVLDKTAYANLLKPSESEPIGMYSSFENSLYSDVVMKYMGSHDVHPAEHKDTHDTPQTEHKGAH